MLFIILLSLVTFAIAASAAFFSVYGLAHTFVGTFWGVVLMGSALEAGKLMAASYLYRYWKSTHVLLKSGIIAVSFAVMILTSMGIYGYLSYGYQADVLPLKQKADQVKLLEDEKDRALARKKQIDDLLISNSGTLVTSLTGADGFTDNKAVNALAVSSRSRDKLAKQYQAEQIEVTKRLSALDKELLPLKQELIVAESHTGPIVSIAKALNADTDSASKYLIYLIIFAFDPMAILLTLAVNNAIRLRKEEKELERQDKIRKAKEDAKVKAEIEEILHTHPEAVVPPVDLTEKVASEPEPIVESTHTEVDIQSLIDEAIAQDRAEREPEYVMPEDIDHDELNAAREKLVAAQEDLANVSATVIEMAGQVNELMPAIIALEEESSVLAAQNKKLASDFTTIAQEYDSLLAEKDALAAEKAEIEKILAEVLAYNVEKAESKVEEPVVVEEPTPIVTTPAPTMVIPVKRSVELPRLDAVADTFPMGGNASFGTEFPTNPIKGDLFLRVDTMPSQLFKWSGTRWIEADKSLSDSYAYNEDYIKLLVDKIATGEQDIDDLSSIEQNQVQEYLLKQDNNG